MTYPPIIMGKTLLKDFKYESKDLTDKLDEASTWVGLFWEAATTFLWLVVATGAGGNSWAWALSYVVIGIAFSGSTMNSLCNVKKLLYGDMSIVHFALNFVAHVLGAIAAYSMASQIGFAAPGVPDHGLSFGEWNWKTFFFGREFWGIFLYCLFNRKSENESGIPASLWKLLTLAVAFQVGGANFVFVTARVFTGFASFAAGSTWCFVLAQVWAVLLACVVGDYVWHKYY